MEQKINDLSEKIINKIDERFKVASSILPPTIDDELGSDIATGRADIFQIDGHSQQELSKNDVNTIYTSIKVSFVTSLKAGSFPDAP